MPKGDQVPEAAVIRCKPKHKALKKSTPGILRSAGDLRSRCPGWASQTLQDKLLNEALVDPDGGTDCNGRPRKLWNAVNGTTFVGVSSSEPEPAYNCYPEVAATGLADELYQRSRRSIEDLLTADDRNEEEDGSA